jgi:chloride channel 3/4/5
MSERTDWIHDSILERNRRLRREEEIERTLRDANGAINLRWAWAQLRRIGSAGQSWFIVSLVGELAPNTHACMSDPLM